MASGNTAPDADYRRLDLATGTHAGTSKLHVVTLWGQPYPRDTSRNALWDATPLCHAHSRYYWRLRAETDDDERCVRCFQRWRAMGQPRLVNAPPPTPRVAEITLPWGWREVEPEGLEQDMHPSDDTVKRKEVRRWVRGDRYVRICAAIFEKEPPDERKVDHYLHTGWLGAPGTDRWHRGGSLAALVQIARTYMLLGGSDRY